MSEAPLHIALIDDHRLFRQGLMSILEKEPMISSIQDYPSARSFLENPERRKAQVLFLDINMPEMNGLIALKQLREKQPDLRIVMLSMSINYSNIQEAIRLGVKGYLNKTSEKSEVLEAISKVSAGQYYYSAEVHAVMAGSFQSEETIDTIALTDREKQVLGMICKELSTHEIAERLNISSHTVETHRRNLLSKTGSKNVAGLVKFAFANNLY